MTAALTYIPLSPWLPATRRLVLAVVMDMAERDREEIMALRPTDNPESVVANIGQLIGGGLHIDGFVALREHEGKSIPVAVAAAFRDSLPRVANVAFFGRRGHARVMPDIYRELERRSRSFAETHDIALAQVPIMETHAAARRMARSIGARETFDYGPIGRGGQNYIHAIWRLDHGRYLRRSETENHRAETRDHAERLGGAGSRA